MNNKAENNQSYSMSTVYIEWIEYIEDQNQRHNLVIWMSTGLLGKHLWIIER